MHELIKKNSGWPVRFTVREELKNASALLVCNPVKLSGSIFFLYYRQLKSRVL